MDVSPNPFSEATTITLSNAASPHPASRSGSALAEAGTDAAGLCAAWSLGVAGDVPGASTTRAADRWGRCGPAGALLAAAEVCSGAAGRHLILAADPAGHAAAVILEREP